MVKIWVIYTMMFGYGVPTLNSSDRQFDTQSGCELYLHSAYSEDVVKVFKLVCVDDSPLMCQGKVCE